MIKIREDKISCIFRIKVPCSTDALTLTQYEKKQVDVLRFPRMSVLCRWINCQAIFQSIIDFPLTFAPSLKEGLAKSYCDQ